MFELNKLDEMIMRVTIELCNAMLGKINDRFLTISFEIIDSKIKIRFVLETVSEIEKELIEEILFDLDAMQEENIILPAEVLIGKEQNILSCLVFAKKIS